MILLDNIDRIHTTEMGIGRIQRNLKLDTVDVVEYCKKKILDKNCNIYRQGKNWSNDVSEFTLKKKENLFQATPSLLF